MTGASITVAGIEIPSSDPAFLEVVAVHVLFGLAGAISGIPGSHGAPKPPEQLGQAAYQRHGDVVHFSADCVLCGQRKEPAALARLSSGRLLAGACCGWDTAHYSCAVVAPIGADPTTAVPAVIDHIGTAARGDRARCALIH